MRRIALSLLAAGLCACPAIDLGADGGTTLVVGPSGGIFFRQGAVLDFPRNAVSGEVEITVTIVDTGVPEVPERKRISFGYRLTPSSQKFATPIKLTLPVIDDRVPQAVDPATYDSRRKEGSDAYLALPAARTLTIPEPPVTVVEAQTDRLGLFWLTSPAQPNVARLEVTPAQATLAVGGTQQFAARVVDPTGASIDAAVTWSVAPPRVASLDAAGLLTAKAPGTAVVTARAGAQSATATVSVPGTTVGPRSFVHDNPFPTGNDLFGGALAPGGLGTVFCGANGTVLARDAAGAWTRLFSAPGLALKGVGGRTADDAVAVGAMGTSGMLVEFHGAGAAPTARPFPTSVPQALWYDGTHGMAVGTGNDVLIRRNGAWGLESSPSFETLLAVVGDGAGGFVTVGSRGSIYQWDPVRGVWDSLYQTQLSVLLTAAAFTDATGLDAWAVGGAKLWHFTGAGWTAENLPATPALAHANALGLLDGRVVIAGAASTGGGLVLTWPLPSGADGGTTATWSSQPLRGPQVAQGLFGGGLAGAQGFVVGEYGAVWEWDHGAQAFQEVSHGFYGDVVDVAVLPGDVLAAVNECTTPACTSRTGTVMHQGGGAWQPLGGTSPFGGEALALAASGPSDVVVSTEAGLFRWDGAQWSPLSVPNQDGLIYDLRFCGATLFGVGQNGNWYRGTSAAFAHAGVVAATDLWSVWCPSAQEVWTAGDGLLAVRLGTSAWAGRDSQTVRHSFWRAGWSPGGGEAWTFGAATYGVYWDTAQLNQLQALGGILPEVVTSLWGSSADNLYAVGLSSAPQRFGFALRFDGVTWALVDSGSQRKVTAIDGRSATEVWVGTQGGGLLRAVAP